MKNVLWRILSYTRAIWEGPDHLPSIKRLMVLGLFMVFLLQTGVSDHKYDVEAGLMLTLLGLTVWANLAERKLSQDQKQKSDE